MNNPPDVVTKADLESLRDELKTFFLEQVGRSLLVKVYPSITVPNSGDVLSRAAIAHIAVTIRSNKPNDAAALHSIRITSNESFYTPATGTAVVNIATADWAQDAAGVWSATKNLAIPTNNGEFLILAHMTGESPVVPINHVDKIAIKITA